MGLSFTSISDRHGAALFVIYDGSELDRRKWSDFADRVSKETGAQTVVLSVKDQDGERVRDFYDLDIMTLPHVLVVRDSDELAQQWAGQHLPQLTDVTYALRQVGV